MPVIFTVSGALIGPGAIAKRKCKRAECDEESYCGGGIFIAILHAGAELSQDALRKQWRGEAQHSNGHRRANHTEHRESRRIVTGER